MGPSVSVVMPVFNSGQYLSDSIESVLCQTYSDFELLCVDNAQLMTLCLCFVKNLKRTLAFLFFRIIEEE